MSLINKLILSLVIASIASTLTTLLLQGELFNLQLLLAFFIATAATALITTGASGATASPGIKQTTKKAPSRDTSREHGRVKWFNISKGFGFIAKDDGEEIFVHFRSIRGEGRRGLRDGQSVSFIVAESEKGPQAEDVVGED
jgi:CspA family cold shock protein